MAAQIRLALAGVWAAAIRQYTNGTCFVAPAWSVKIRAGL